MTENIELEAGSTTQIGFKGKSFFLFVPRTNEPLEGNRARPQADGHLGIVEPVRGETEVCLKEGNAEPVRVENAPFAGTGGFNPAKRHRTPAAVVPGKVKKPPPQKNRGTDRVDEHQASHRTL